MLRRWERPETVVARQTFGGVDVGYDVITVVPTTIASGRDIAQSHSVLEAV